MPELFKGTHSETGADADLASELAGVRLVVPQLSFTERMVLCHGDQEIHLVHRPGSAPGAIWVELPRDQIVFAGDSLVLGVPPLMQDADLEAWMERLADLRKARFPAEVIVPGRGQPCAKSDVKFLADFLRVVRRRLETLARGKKTRADAARLADDLLDRFKVPAALREHYLRRLRVGLEQQFDRLAAG
jgi:glyoxylase-like metal-dependent hydrolase (beta-lactamase superfamily II)